MMSKKLEMNLEWEISKIKSLDEENSMLQREFEETNRALTELNSSIATLKKERKKKIMNFLFGNKAKEKVMNKMKGHIFI